MKNRNAPCWCGSGVKWKKCHYPQEAPIDSSALAVKYRKSYGIILKTPQQIEEIRTACRITAQILDAVCAIATAGVTTGALNDLSDRLHREAGAIPGALNYGSPPFPKGICTSLNEVICHGIPGDTVLQEGDILNIDIVSRYKGYYGDCSRMVVIGKTSPERQRVVDVSYECLMRSIAILKPGVPVNAIGKTIEEYAHAHGCSVVHQFVGHGVGLKMHENPQIPHCHNFNTTPLVPGMVFTIEPMINAGVPDAVIDPVDHWTARTLDGKASAQWEHTILITNDGHEILTPWNC